MKITTKQIQNIIKEELDKLLHEEETSNKLKQAIAKAIDDKTIRQYDEKVKQQIFALIDKKLPDIENPDGVALLNNDMVRADPQLALEMLRTYYDKFEDDERETVEMLEEYPLSGDNDTKKQIIAVQKIKSKDLSGLNLRGADLSGVKFDQMDISATNLRGANLSHARFTGVSCEESDLSDANLSGSYLYDTDLKETFMLRANLSGAELRAVDLEYTSLYEAILNGANLSSAKIYYTDLRKAKYDDETIWPEGFDPQDAGAVGY